MANIVILDDRVTNRNIFARLASTIEPGVGVKTFPDPIEALNWLGGNVPDLIVTDFKMPHMDGAEFIRHARMRPELVDVPIVVITVYEERSFRLRALDAGATDFLQSPVDHHEFVTRARNLLKMRRQQLQLASRADDLARELAHSERSREEAIRDSSERLAQVIDTVPAMISATDRDGRLMFANAYYATVAGIDPTTLVGRSAADVFGEEHGARGLALDRMVVDTGRPLPAYEEELRDRAGRKRVFLTTKSPLRDGTSEIVGVLTNSLDITDRKHAESHLLHMAHHDALTDLPNRTLLRDRLRREVARARRGDRLFALHMIDLDGFKGVNDVLGHSVGDRFLKAVAQRLKSVVGETDTVARLGGDEFAVLQTRISSSENAAAFSAKLLEAVAKPYTIAGERVSATASIGVTVYPTDGDDVEDLVKNADLAMYQAKADGGNVFRFFAADMQARAREAAMLDVEMRQALAENQFELFYQPQMRLETGEIVGAEALLRWRRPGAGMVSPGAFLSRAEETGMIVAINEWVLREACWEAKTWTRKGLPPLRVGVNLSAVQFRKQNVPLLVARILGETGLDPKRLDLELTESIMIDNCDGVVNDLQQLRALGVQISIDDFGTGYSSLSYVRRFPVDRLKIDQAFIRNVATDPDDAAILRAILNLGHSLELEVVAEGVETAEQLVPLRNEGCDEVQGYFFARPMPADDFVAFVLGDAVQRKIA